jgi:Big-like domain-containing protein/MBG domain-containing protein
MVNGVLIQQSVPCDYTRGPASLLSGVALGGSGPYAATPAEQAALATLEAQAVSATLADHGLPSSASAMVQTWGRDDALAELWGLLVQAIKTPAGSRTDAQRGGVSWLTGMFHRHAVATADKAGLEYVKWAGLDQKAYLALLAQDPTKDQLTTFMQQFPATYDNGGSAHNPGVSTGGYCAYRSPAPYADEYTANVFHQGGAPQQCYAPCPSFTQCLPITPTADQFIRWGEADVDEPTFANQSFASSARDIATGVGLGTVAAGVGVGVGLGSGLTSAALIDTGLVDFIYPFLVEPLAASTATPVVLGAGEVAEVAGSTAATAVGFAVAVAIAAIVIAVMQGINVVQADQVPGTIAGAVVAARSAVPDLAPMLADKSQAAGLFALFVGATLPSPRIAACDNSTVDVASSQVAPCLNAPAVPPIDAADPGFRIRTESGQPRPTDGSITWTDAQSGLTTVGRLSGTSFVDTVTDTSGDTASVQSLRMRYSDWGGHEQTAWVDPDGAGGYNFLIERDRDRDGPPLDPTTCKASGACAYSPTINYVAPDGSKLSASIVPAPQPSGSAPTLQLAPEGNPGCADCNPIYSRYDKPALIRGSFTPGSAGDRGTVTVQWGDGASTSEAYGPGVTGGVFSLRNVGGHIGFQVGHVYNAVNLFTATVTITSVHRQSASARLLRDIRLSDGLTAQWITGFSAIPGHTYGDAPFTVYAHGGSSAQPVNFVATGVVPGTNLPVCALSERKPFFVNASATVTILGPGTCTVSAIQAGTTGWGPAPPVTQSFTVVKAPLKLTAADVSLLAGEVPSALTATFDGFAKGEDAGVLTGLSCSALDQAGHPVTSDTPVGVYPIRCSASATNYSVTSQPGTLTIRSRATSTTLTQPLSTPMFGQAVNLRAEVADADAVAGALPTTGTVTFMVDGLPVGSTSAGAAASAGVSLNDLSPGPHKISASYSGDPTHSGSADTHDLTVGCAVTVTGTVPALKVTQPVCVEGGTVTGSISVSSGGALSLDGATVGGSVYGLKAIAMRICGSSITGPVTIQETSGAVRLDGPGCGPNSILGPVVVR